ncbi:MAG: hypothetical protein HFJ54_04190 [Clostridia bacterium]|nr:hypothetical protein [Clostridia bacterium]
MEECGASIGTVIAELTVTFIQIYFVRNDFNFKEVIKSGKNYLFASIIMFIGCLLIGKFLDTSLISLFVIVVLGVALYGISLIILKDDFIFEVLNKVKNKIKQN